MLTDPGCDAPNDTSERGTLACDNGVDDDGDGFKDYAAAAAIPAAARSSTERARHDRV